MSEVLTSGFANMLDGMAQLFETRAGKAEGHAETAVRTSKDYWIGFAAAYQDAARECRNAATKLRQP